MIFSPVFDCTYNNNLFTVVLWHSVYGIRGVLNIIL